MSVFKQEDGKWKPWVCDPTLGLWCSLGVGVAFVVAMALFSLVAGGVWYFFAVVLGGGEESFAHFMMTPASEM